MSIHTRLHPSQLLEMNAQSFDVPYSALEYGLFYHRSNRWEFFTLQYLKRLFDILGASIALILFLPLMLLIALLVYMNSPGPIFYRSLRVGHQQKPFYMLKFRTMVVNADRSWRQLRQTNQLEGQLFKLRQDPRLTPLGGFLRKYSLDELPQFINVLKGEMSLVGPRPFIRAESRMFKAPYNLRFKLVPGITGPWQVNGRSNLPFDKLCHIELDYVLNWNLWQDGLLLLKTIPSVLLKKGAF